MLVHAHANPALTGVMRGISLLGEPVTLITLSILVMVFFTRTARPRLMLPFAVTVAGAEVLDQLLKLLFHRARPATFFGLAEPSGYSFPSGHSLVSFAFFGAMVIFGAPRRWWHYLAAAVPIGAIGLSRVYLGMHYPTDVLGGWAFAAIWLLIVDLVRQRARQ